MFIKKTVRKSGDKTYTTYLLVESINTPKGPRHRTICSLGRLEPGSKDDWLDLASRIQAALGGQPSLFPDARVDEALAKVRACTRDEQGNAAASQAPVPAVLPVLVDGVETIEPRAAGALHVGHQMWLRIGADEVLKNAGLTAQCIRLTEFMTLNRLIQPESEHAMVDWARQSAVSEVLGVDFASLNHDRLYRNMDRLHGKRVEIEKGLRARECSLFNLSDTLVLYDLTNTYFEGQVLATPKAKRGMSKEKRTDCKLVAMGLMVDGDGFPIGHEIFEGSISDGKTVKQMLDALEARTGRTSGALCVMDRGFASEDNRKLVISRQHHYLVAGYQNQRGGLMDDFESLDGWEEIQPNSSKIPIQIKRIIKEDEALLLCISKARGEKERGIRENQEKRLVEALENLAKTIDSKYAKGKPMADEALGERMGRLRERYPRAARYYEIQREENKLVWRIREAAYARAQELDGAYFLRTSNKDLEPEEIWRTYTTLTRVESAFRDLKSALNMRPIHHRKEIRVETHLFLCVLAYHLQTVIEKTMRDAGDHRSWETLRKELQEHAVITVLLPSTDGRTLAIRKSSIPNAYVSEIYKSLKIPTTLCKPIRTWI